jgi:hypothetical protein
MRQSYSPKSPLTTVSKKLSPLTLFAVVRLTVSLVGKYSAGVGCVAADSYPSVYRNRLAGLWVFEASCTHPRVAEFAGFQCET